jgi:hypothetical protein
MNNINPYDYMLSLRDNKILFSYMTECSVKNFQDDDDWLISGKSSEGELLVAPLINDFFRLSIPILAPAFISPTMIGDILLGLQPTIEGLMSFVYKEGKIYFNYNICFDPNNRQSLDKSLLLFLREREEIKDGFKYLIQDYNRIQNMAPQNSDNSPDEDLNSLWDVMNGIDNLDDENSEDME